MYQCIILYGNSEHPTSKSCGPFRIATELRKNNFSVICIDLSAFDYGFDPALRPFLKQAIGENTLWIGISGTFLYDIFGLPHEHMLEKIPTRNSTNKNTKHLVNFIDYVKSLNKKIKFLIGGTRSWGLNQFDFVHFEGYVDQQIVDYSKWLLKEKIQIPLSFYSNHIVNKEWNNFYSSQILYTEDDIVMPHEALSTETARGCIFKCKYCAYPLNGKTKGEWIKHAENFKDELIRNYENHGVTKYNFSDDTFNDSVDKINYLHDEVFSKLPFKLQFTTYLRLDLLVRNPTSADTLRASGLKSALFGIETLNPKSAKSIGKGLDPTVQIDFLRELKRTSWCNILVHSGFIFGLPHDTLEDFDKFDEWAYSNKNPLDSWEIQPLYIQPKETGYQKNAYSFLDKEYAEYGYEIIVDPQYPTPIWKNKITKLDFSICELKGKQLTEKFKQTHPRYTLAQGWSYFYLNRFISEQELMTKCFSELVKKYPIETLFHMEKIKYRTKLYQRLAQNK